MAAVDPTEAIRPRVLVVDDQPEAASELQRALADEVEVLYARDGQRGLELVLSVANVSVVIASAHMRTRMTEDPQDMTIVMMIISLAHALDLKVIAEGPETVQQAQLLRLLKCDQIQGYVVAKPQPAEQVSQLLGKTMSFAPPAASIMP
jgi:EAL domain-containing protein (putative c-di-GMP-specific phosphodiesterase class I)